MLMLLSIMPLTTIKLTQASDSPIIYHDVAVIDVKPASPIIYDNWTVNIKAVVLNNGSYTESFNVRVYYGTNASESQSVTNLPPGETATLIFKWNTSETTESLYMQYTIKAEASVVTNETMTENNLLINGPITVVILGDVNGDQTVNILDIIVISNAFGSTPENPSWNILGDLNGDERVTVNDLILIARRFGQHWP